jgi:DNA-binding transcriptional MerR regulator
MVAALSPARPAEKAPDAFRTISEVADDLDLPQHVLRFWETRFPHIKPLKRGGGRRYYRRDDVDLLKGIRHLLYGEGYTIKGVQRILKESGPRFVQSIGRGEQAVEPASPEERGEALEEGPEVEAQAALPAPEAVVAAPAPGLTAGEVASLRLALDELLECRRVLATLKAPADPNELEG